MAEDKKHGNVDRGVRMLEVAAAAGVSRTTVSNVMRGLPSVADDVRERVLATAEVLGYIYNRGAASLRMRQSHLVGLVIPDIGNPFITEAVRGAHELLSEHGYLVATIETTEDLDRQGIVLQSLAEHRVDGFLLIPALASDAVAVGRALGGLPVITLNRPLAIDGSTHVGPDEIAVARVGAKHLVEEHSCSSIAYFGGPQTALPRKKRLAALREYVDAAGVKFDGHWSTPTEPTAKDAYLRAAALIATRALPEGVQCHSDTVAYGLLRALHDAGLAGATRVIGCDDLPDSGYFHPAVTSTSVDSSLIGRAAAGALLARLGEEVPPIVVPPPHLVARESCGCSPLSEAFRLRPPEARNDPLAFSNGPLM